MSAIFSNHDKKFLRFLHSYYGRNEISAACRDQIPKIQPPLKPSDLCIEYEAGVYYLVRITHKKYVRLFKIEGQKLPLEGWILRKQI